LKGLKKEACVVADFFDVLRNVFAGGMPNDGEKLTTLKCPNCGAVLTPKEKSRYYECAHCGMKTYIVQSDTVKKTQIRTATIVDIIRMRIEEREAVRKREERENNRNLFIAIGLLLMILMFL
jgi:DNA-directed RNA polymerase subunit RPC12/RpoP